MKFVAMFLPQFHADPFNSAWWGEGFTEWNSVRSAVPLYPGHAQPKVPLEGYFDLSDPAEIARQAQQAKSWGIDAFAIYDYWYEGKQPLGTPLATILDRPDINVAFSLCWANHSWTRSWTNRAGALDVLVEQTYPSDPNLRERHYSHLCRAFADSRYLRVNDHPLLQIYNPEYVPRDYLSGLRDYVRERLNIEIHMDALITAWRPDWSHLSSFDSATLFQPSATLFSPTDIFTARTTNVGWSERIRSLPISIKRLIYLAYDLLPDRMSRFSYKESWARLIEQFAHSQHNAPLPLNPMAFVNFDNTPRYRKRARIIDGYDVDIFREGLVTLADLSMEKDEGKPLFINAWNEWGEGAYLQPDTIERNARLEAVKNAKSRITIST